MNTFFLFLSLAHSRVRSIVACDSEETFSFHRLGSFFIAFKVLFLPFAFVDLSLSAAHSVLLVSNLNIFKTTTKYEIYQKAFFLFIK
jgi:hypothetical protein